MAKATLTQRVEVLAHKVDKLGTLPARVGAVERELKDFRADVAAEFGKVHAELALVRGEFATGRDKFGTIRDEFATIRGEFATVRSEIREGDEETRRHMRVLYGDLVERIKIMGEGIEELRRRPDDASFGAQCRWLKQWSANYTSQSTTASRNDVIGSRTGTNSCAR